MWTRTKTLNSYIWGIMQILLIESEICHTFHYYVSIISRLMTKFVTALVEIVYFLSIVTSFSVQAIWRWSFSLQIHLSSWYLRAAAVLILFSNMVTLRSSFKLWFSWKCFVKKFTVAWPFFDVLTMFGEALWKLFSCMSNI